MSYFKQNVGNNINKVSHQENKKNDINTNQDGVY